jgi:hypothetical protein
MDSPMVYWLMWGAQSAAGDPRLCEWLMKQSRITRQTIGGPDRIRSTTWIDAGAVSSPPARE